MAVQLDERFWSKVNKDAPNGCWEWTASKRETGYGQFVIGKKNWRAHRLAYMHSFGPVPDGMVVDHACWNRQCVNPAHLRAVTAKGNIENRSKANKNSLTGVRGVTWDKRGRKYACWGKSGGKTVYLGGSRDLGEAANLVRKWRAEHYPHSLMDQAD